MNDLLTQFKLGKNEAVREIYRLAFPVCANLIINNKGTMDDARDVFQEALIILHRKAKNDDFQLRCSMTTYLYSVARNLWMRQQERYNKKGLVLIVDEPEQEFIQLEEEELTERQEIEQKHQLIADMIKELKEECQKILLCFYYQKMPLAQLAEELGYSSNFIKVKKGRCMKSLQEKVQEAFKKEQ